MAQAAFKERKRGSAGAKRRSYTYTGPSASGHSERSGYRYTGAEALGRAGGKRAGYRATGAMKA